MPVSVGVTVLAAAGGLRPAPRTARRAARAIRGPGERGALSQRDGRRLDRKRQGRRRVRVPTAAAIATTSAGCQEADGQARKYETDKPQDTFSCCLLRLSSTCAASALCRFRGPARKFSMARHIQLRTTPSGRRGPGIGWFAVATSLHPDAQGLAAQDRWITWAVLVSLLLHTPLFLSSGIWRRGLLDREPGASAPRAHRAVGTPGERPTGGHTRRRPGARHPVCRGRASTCERDRAICRSRPSTTTPVTRNHASKAGTPSGRRPIGAARLDARRGGSGQPGGESDTGARALE